AYDGTGFGHLGINILHRPWVTVMQFLGRASRSEVLITRRNISGAQTSTAQSTDASPTIRNARVVLAARGRMTTERTSGIWDCIPRAQQKAAKGRRPSPHLGC